MGSFSIRYLKTGLLYPLTPQYSQLFHNLGCSLFILIQVFILFLLAEKIKEQFKHTSASTVASNSDLGKRLKRQRAAWGDAVRASPRTPSCIAGSWNHNLSKNRRLKPSYFFWMLQSGWKRTLEEAQGSSETKSHRAAHKQDAERAAQSEGTDEKPGDYCSSPSWVTPLGYSKAAFHMLRAKPPHTKAESKSLKGVHHPQIPRWWFPSQHSLRTMDSLLNSVTPDLSLRPYIARPYTHFLSCNF